MFRLPPAIEIPSTREMITEFRGYNHNLRIAGNEFYDMENMSSDLYPVLSPRKQRYRIRYFNEQNSNFFNGLYAHNALCWALGTGFYYNNVLVGELDERSEKQFVSMGAYILIWPDKVYYNTETGEFGSLENEFIGYGGTQFIVTPCKPDGTEYEYEYISQTAPEDPQDGEYWCDISGDEPVLKQYSESYAMWQGVATAYTKLKATGIGKGFSQYDGVTISGFDDSAGLNGEHVLYGVDDDYIIIVKLLSATAAIVDTVKVSRKVPDMDFVCEHDNRIWGCSSKNHEIYACVLGDPKNWYRFLGVSTDSYAATIGSLGDFTGCISYLNQVLFFKENEIIKLYGNRPANFQLESAVCRGVQKGSEKSLVIANDTLYYKAREDFCAYNGNLPTSISKPLGNIENRSGVSAGALGNKVYMALAEGIENQQQHIHHTRMYIYDTDLGLWYKESGEAYAINSTDGIWRYQIGNFAVFNSTLYFYDGAFLWKTKNDGQTDYDDEYYARPEGRFPWFAQTGDIGLNSPDNKYISKLQLRMEVDADALVRIEVQYDNEDEWVEKYRVNPTKKRSVLIPIIPRRCDTMRLRISGRGDARIYSLAKTIEEGSELNGY